MFTMHYLMHAVFHVLLVTVPLNVEKSTQSLTVDSNRDVSLRKFRFALGTVRSESESSQCVYRTDLVGLPNVTTFLASKHVL